MDRPSRAKSHLPDHSSPASSGWPPCWASPLAFGLIDKDLSGTKVRQRMKKGVYVRMTALSSMVSRSGRGPCGKLYHGSLWFQNQSMVIHIRKGDDPDFFALKVLCNLLLYLRCTKLKYTIVKCKTFLLTLLPKLFSF
jgi:hypothetical protein